MEINRNSWHYRFTNHYQRALNMDTSVRHVRDLCSYIRQFLFVLLIGWPFLIAASIVMAIAAFGIGMLVLSPLLHWITPIQFDSTMLLVVGVIESLILFLVLILVRKERKDEEAFEMLLQYREQGLEPPVAQPSMFTMMYRNWKDKHCTLVEIV